MQCMPLGTEAKSKLLQQLGDNPATLFIRGQVLRSMLTEGA
jgi:hypothetical protein